MWLHVSAVQVAKAVLKEAVSGSKFAVEAVEQSDLAHITFQKVQLCCTLNATGADSGPYTYAYFVQCVTLAGQSWGMLQSMLSGFYSVTAIPAACHEYSTCHCAQPHSVCK